MSKLKSLHLKSTHLIITGPNITLTLIVVYTDYAITGDMFRFEAHSFRDFFLKKELRINNLCLIMLATNTIFIDLLHITFPEIF